MSGREFNFDGIVGPTHNYAGLSHGNVASAKHKSQTANPRAAALEGLAKMKFVSSLGIGQAMLPPLFRPRIRLLHDLGFRGSPEQMVESAGKVEPALLAACYSASSMWTANAATVSPSADCADGKLHLTPANLSTLLHRSIEADSTRRTLRAIFSDGRHFEVHPALFPCQTLTDEGAANHTRLCGEYDGPGIETFVFGRSALDAQLPRPQKFPARQTLESCQAIARMHQLDAENTFHIQQCPGAIDAGVFHNDVISVGNRNVLLCHERAFVDQANQLRQLSDRFEALCQQPLHIVEIAEKDLSLPDTVSSYLFNSQLLSKPDGSMALICPSDCEENSASKACTDQILEGDDPINQVEFLNLRQSMNNGGGPACLRLRVVLTEEQESAIHQGVVYSESLHQSLSQWVETYYRDSISPDDLRDPKLIDESYRAFEALSKILNLPLDVLADE